MGRLNCKNAKTCGHNMCFELACRNYEPHETAKQTRADRIRAMSDEELARWISDMWHGFVSKPWCDFRCQNCREGDDYRCEKCALEWLKQPADL